MKFEKNLVGVNRIRKEDKINQLPNCLLCEILMYIPTKDVVKTSVLCRRWRSLWLSVPKLDMEINCSEDFDKLAFLDKFIKVKGDLLLQRAKLRYLGNGCKYLNKTSINTVMISHKIQHIDVEIDRGHDEVKIPQSIYTSCEKLVSLKLCRATLPKLPMSVSLPCLKIMALREIEVVEDLDIEMLISVCPALETLTIDRMYGVKVSSQSLLSFSLIGSDYKDQTKIKQIVMQTPKLKSLKMNHLNVESFSINDTMNSIVTFNLRGLIVYAVNYPRLLPLVSCIRDLTISLHLFEWMQYEVLRSQPKFHNLSTLRVINIMLMSWDDWSIFLESCPNLKSLALEFPRHNRNEKSMLYVPQCVSSSLELVEVDGSKCTVPYMKKLGSYFMENSALLKKFTLRVYHIKAADRMKLKEFFTSSRRSKACEVIVRSACLCVPCSIYD